MILNLDNIMKYLHINCELRQLFQFAANKEWGQKVFNVKNNLLCHLLVPTIHTKVPEIKATSRYFMHSMNRHRTEHVRVEPVKSWRC